MSYSAGKGCTRGVPKTLKAKKVFELKAENP